MCLKGKRAIVTGGTRGIGKAIVQAFLNQGCSVIFTGTHKKALKISSEAQYWPLDLSDDQSLEEFISRMKALKKLDILVNNAGINIIAPIDEIKTEDWDKVIKINLTGAMRLTKEASSLMKRSKSGGRILNVSSIFGIVSRAKRNAYSASKAGLIGLTRSSALDLAEFSIFVNALCPGFVMTDLTKKILKPEEQKILAQQIPLKRFGMEKEIAQAALFFCSPYNTYITGQTIVVDGGYSIQ